MFFRLAPRSPSRPEPVDRTSPVRAVQTRKAARPPELEPRICGTSALVFRRLFHPVNDDHFDRAFLRLQAESKLFLDGDEDRRAVGIRRRRELNARWRRSTEWRGGLPRIWRPLQL